MLEAVGLSVCVVTFDDQAFAQEYLRQTDLRWPLLIDADRILYRGYGMDRGSAWQIYGPRSIWGYLQLLARGRRLQRSGSDYRQLGGDVLIDPGGIVRLHHVSHGPHDRPDVSEVLAAMR